MNKTLNNITDKLEELANAHNMVNGFAVGDIANIGDDTQKEDSIKLEYPYVWVDYDSITQGIGQTRGTQFLIYTLRLVVLDKYTPSSKNTMEVMSDTAGILNDFIQYISTHSELKEFRLSGSDVQILPVRDNEKDGAEGWTALIPFKIPYQFCASNLPMQQDEVTPPTDSLIFKSNVLYLDATNNDSYPENGSTWFDLSGNNNDANLIGSVVFNNDALEIQEDFELTNSSGNYIELPSTYNDLRITGQEITIEVWVNFPAEGVSTFPSIISHRQSFGINESYSLVRNVSSLGGNYVFSLRTNVTGVNHDFGVAPTFGSWEFITVTYDGSFVRSYINGVEVGTATSQTGNIKDQNVATYIGAMLAGGNLDSNYYANVNINSIRVSTEVLTDSDILNNFNVDKSKFGL